MDRASNMLFMGPGGKQGQIQVAEGWPNEPKDGDKKKKHTKKGIGGLTRGGKKKMIVHNSCGGHRRGTTC